MAVSDRDRLVAVSGIELERRPHVPFPELLREVGRTQHRRHRHLRAARQEIPIPTLVGREARGEGRPETGPAVVGREALHLELREREEGTQLMAAPAERRGIERHVERSERQRVASRTQLDVVASLETFGEPSVVELAGEPSARIEDIRRGAPVGGKEISPRIECRREVVRAAAAMLGVVEGELGERDRVLGPKLAGCERGVQRGERSRRIVGVALDEILPVEQVVGTPADPARGERVARDHPPRLAGIDVPGLDGSPAAGRD